MTAAASNFGIRFRCFGDVESIGGSWGGSVVAVGVRADDMVDVRLFVARSGLHSKHALC